MGPETIFDKIKNIYFKFEYYFAKKWLDRNFGKREYWGSDIEDWINIKK